MTLTTDAGEIVAQVDTPGSATAVACAGSLVAVADGSGGLAIVDVGDPRVDRLAEIYEPKKTVYATVTLIDFAGVARDEATGDELFTAETMGRVKNVDALAFVVRNFADPSQGVPDPAGDVDKLDDELLLADLIIAERRLERIAEAEKKGIATHEIKLQGKALHRIHEQLEAGGSTAGGAGIQLDVPIAARTDRRSCSGA